jgi:hypothetical protein
MALTLKGGLPEMLTLLSHEPLGYPQKLALDPGAFKGTVETQLDLSFPLLQDLALKDITLVARGRLQNVSCPVPVSIGKKKPFLEQGTLSLTVTPEALTLKGQAVVEKEKIELHLKEKFTETPSRRVEVLTQVTSEMLSRWGVEGATQWIQGTFPLTLLYVPAEKDSLVLTADFSPIKLELKGLNWSKEPRAPAQLVAVHQPAKTPQTNTPQLPEAGPSTWRLSFQGPGIEAAGTLSLDTQAGRTALDLPILRTKRTDCTLRVLKNQHLSLLTLQGEKFDAEGLLKGEGRGDGPAQAPGLSPWRVSFNLDNLYLGGETPLREVTGTFEGVEGPETFHITRGKIDGRTVSPLSDSPASFPPSHFVKLVLLPLEKGGKKVALMADNGGECFRAMGWISNMKGGKLTVDATQINPQAPFDVHVFMQSATVLKTPFLTRILMTLASPTAFLNLFSGNETSFSTVKAHLSWKDSVLTFKRLLARNVNSGVSLVGTLNVADNRLSLRGNIIPIYALNRFLGSIPLLGDMLTGGKDDGLGATRFYISGTCERPSIMVNPINILTPGLIKRLFRPDAEAASASSAASKKQRKESLP